MRSDAKASTAGSTQPQAKGLGGVLATRAPSPSAKGGSAPKGGTLLLALAVALLTLALAAASAVALAPSVISSEVSAVGATTAVLGATINPEGEATTFRFEYGPADCSANPCTATPVPSGNVGTGAEAVKVSREIAGLTPATTYHYRVVATNASGPSAGEDRTFTTYSTQAADTCPNREFRTSAAANLPDCRAYEMVSPVDKNGGDILVNQGLGTEYIQAAIEGGGITYTADTAFADAVSGNISNQYLSSRGAEGWTTQALDPVKTQTLYDPAFSLVEDFRNAFALFTPDLSVAFLKNNAIKPLTAEPSLVGAQNLYMRDNTNGTYRNITNTGAPLFWALKEGSNDGKTWVPKVTNHSADLSHIVYQGYGGLTPDAAPAAEGDAAEIYDFSGGAVHVASVLPNGQPSPFNDHVGMEGGIAHGNRVHALSEDGSRLFWMVHWPTFDSPSRVYVRVNPGQPQSALANGAAAGEGIRTAGSTEVTGVSTSFGAFAVGQSLAGEGIPIGTMIAAVGAGTLTLSQPATSSASDRLEAYSECTEAAKACTVPISEQVTTGTSKYRAASVDGSRVLFTSQAPGPGEGEGLYLLDVDKAIAGEAGAGIKIAGKAQYGVIGASENLSHIYFISEEALAPGATEGERNVYLYREGEYRFIATLAQASEGDGSAADGNGAYWIINHTGRASADGSGMTFTSVRPLTGYDNRELEGGEPALEVYHYDADADELVCASCNPSGARPAYTVTDGPSSIESWQVAASLVGGQWVGVYANRTLSADGDRLFFNAYDSLAPADINGAQDVYQWEAPGTGDCAVGSPHYSVQNGGCVSLISTGKSPEASEFIDASADGSDVFFKTQASIDPRDEGLLDVYVARVKGGYPPPPPEPTACEGDSCQSPSPPPTDPTLASAAFRGAGTPRARASCGAQARRAAKLLRQAKLLRKGEEGSDAQELAELHKAERLAKQAHKLSRNAKRCRRVNRRAGR